MAKMDTRTQEMDGKCLASLAPHSVKREPLASTVSRSLRLMSFTAGSTTLFGNVMAQRRKRFKNSSLVSTFVGRIFASAALIRTLIACHKL